MAFLQRNLYTPETSFTPLFRLLEDFDTYTRQADTASPQPAGHQAGSLGSRRPRLGLPRWQPRFDVRETRDSYELHGELPGVDRRDVEIEFSDPQTMLIRGRTERSYEAGTPPSPPAGLIEGCRGAAQIESADTTPRKATVEEEAESASHEATDAEARQVERVSTAAAAAAAAAARKKSGEARYWLSERSVGEFSRSFNFPSRVDQDAVTANIRDGILNVRVPKARHEARRITVE